eukprot:COSAG02_NODE_4545_length_5228_cov_3.929031_1_plen_64_part_00
MTPRLLIADAPPTEIRRRPTGAGCMPFSVLFLDDWMFPTEPCVLRTFGCVDFSLVSHFRAIRL